MVLKGQFLERPTLIPTTGGLVLEGLAHRGELRPGLLVLPPPPFEGGGMDHVVAAELAFAASRLGFATLRFNYRGVGGSQRSGSATVEELFDDACAALELAFENAPGAPPAVAAIGASDAVALRLAAEREVCGLALINPSVVRPGELGAVGKRVRQVCVVVAEHDAGVDRAAWAAALAHLALVPGADRSYQRNLPMVGKAVGCMLEKLHAAVAPKP